jgi:hypothetical protein
MSERYTEKQAIAALERLAKRWPDTLTLFSWSGSLQCVDAEQLHEQGLALPVGPVIQGIDNEGGDPDPHPDSYREPTDAS